MKTKIIAIFGKSGTGKGTLQNLLIKLHPDFNKIVSFTTRPKRDNEIEGQDYFFVNHNEFINLIKEQQMLEYTNFNNWYYGTGIKSIKKDSVNIGVFNIQGICSILKLLPKAEYEIFPIEVIADDTTRLLRAINRENNPNCAEICRRFLADEGDFKDIPFIAYNFFNEKGKTLEDNWKNFRSHRKILNEPF